MLCDPPCSLQIISCRTFASPPVFHAVSVQPGIPVSCRFITELIFFPTSPGLPKLSLFSNAIVQHTPGNCSKELQTKIKGGVDVFCACQAALVNLRDMTVIASYLEGLRLYSR